MRNLTISFLQEEQEHQAQAADSKGKATSLLVCLHLYSFVFGFFSVEGE